MKSMKEIIIGRMVHGEETLEEIRYVRKSRGDYSGERTRSADIVGRLHRDSLRLRVSEIIEETKDVKSFRLVSADGYLPPFEAGQYVNIFTEIGGVRTSRPYSISSSPRQRAYYQITVGRIPKGFVSDYFLDKVAVGAEFEANGPAGCFRYNPLSHRRKQLFLAGGTGITPFMSMLSEALDGGVDRDAVLIYGVRSQELAIFDERLRDYAARHPNFSYHLVVSDESACWDGRKGFIDARCIAELVPDYKERTAYICGPSVMYEFCVKELRALGMAEKDIRREMFGARQDIQNEPGWPRELRGTETFKLRVGKDRVVEAKSGESLLVALERSGVRMNVCCRSGECSLCRVRLVSGKVFQPRGVLLRLADEKYGYVHSCKSYPISDVEILL